MINTYTKENMTLEDIFEDKRGIIENILDEGYQEFEADIENDEEYTLSTDEIAELYYDLIKMYFKRLSL
jgi:hypothetical protein